MRGVKDECSRVGGLFFFPEVKVKFSILRKNRAVTMETRFIP